MIRRLQLAVSLILLLPIAAHCADTGTNRSAAWAQPLHVDGVKNLNKVSDALYRSAQPSKEGLRNLERLGIKTIVNLRSSDSDAAGRTGTHLGGEQIPMNALHPNREQAVQFLKVVTDTNRAPVLVHCEYGSDRTGTMCALYRIAVQGWTKEEAVREMTQGGYGFHPMFQNLPRWITDLDIESLKRDAGIKPSPAPPNDATKP